MNDKLRNLQVEPDPQVWNSIRKTLRRKAAVKYTAAAVVATSVFVAAAVAVVNWPEPQSSPVHVDSPFMMAYHDASAEATLPGPVSETSPVADVPSKADPMAVTEAQPSESYADLEPTGSPFVDRYVSPAKREKSASQEPVVAGTADKKAAPAKEPTAQPASEPKANKASSAADGVEIYVPNAFIPDGDVAENRLFKVVPSEIVSDFRMFVYDRSGRMVFESNSVSTTWDGTFKGQKLPQSAYVYVIHYTAGDGTKHTKKGSVVLVR